MKLIVEIDGREAIPVRAIPLATDWESMHPDEIADVLAEPDERRLTFRGLRAYFLDEGKAVAFKRRWWNSSVRWQLRALTTQLQENIADGPMAMAEAGRRWQCESLALLPAGAFVWRDEFEPLYMAAHGAEGVTWVAGALDAHNDAGDEDHEARNAALGKAANERAALVLEQYIESPEIRVLLADALALITLAPTAEADSTALPPSVPRQIEPATDGEFSSATWWDEDLEATYWWGQSSITPLEAALLLCGLDPHVESKDNAEKLATPGEPSGRDFKKMLRSFEGAEIDGQLRTMRKWLGIAIEQGLKRHSWVAEWVAAQQLTLIEPKAEENAVPQLAKTSIDGAETLRETDKAAPQTPPHVAASQERLDMQPAGAVHSIRKRRSDIIDAEIASAEAICPQDATVAEIWLAMIQSIESKGKPFQGLVAGSIKYKDNIGDVRSFSQKNLADRLRNRRKTIAPQA